jgi:CheY-like chemotaxis protein
MPEAVLVLVVEDEELIADLIGQALEDGGYDTVTAASGDAALEVVEARTDELGALVTDINLGGKISGWDVATRARELKPELPVVYTSGADIADWPSKGVPNSVVVNKPFAAAQIVTAVSTVTITTG